MEHVNAIPTEYYTQLKQIVLEYLPGTSEIQLEKMYNECPEAFIGYYIDNILVGVCYGCRTNSEYFQLDGIAVICPHNAHGRGKKLLEFFESSVFKLGYRYISLGSAGGYVERFYIRNGYVPVELKILTKNKDFVSQTKDTKYPISYFQKQGQFIKLVIKVIDYEKMDKDEITKYYDGIDSFYIFEKKISVF